MSSRNGTEQSHHIILQDVTEKDVLVRKYLYRHKVGVFSVGSKPQLRLEG